MVPALLPHQIIILYFLVVQRTDEFQFAHYKFSLQFQEEGIIVEEWKLAIPQLLEFLLQHFYCVFEPVRLFAF